MNSTTRAERICGGIMFGVLAGTLLWLCGAPVWGYVGGGVAMYLFVSSPKKCE